MRSNWKALLKTGKLQMKGGSIVQIVARITTLGFMFARDVIDRAR
jgi:hypothetical protein